MRPSKLGEQESALLTWVASKAPVNTAEVVKGFGEEHNLARTTVTTMLDRLRLKGYLTRKKEGNSYMYMPREEHQSQLREVVGRFVERTLGGSLDPFVAYLNDAQLNDEQKSQLRALVERLDNEPVSEDPDSEEKK